MDYLFDDTYIGPRYRYGLAHRPLAIGSVPRGYIIQSLKPDARFAHGVLEYAQELTEAEVSGYELTYLGMAHAKEN